MWRKSPAKSLNTRIFLTTFGILLLASALTFALVAWSTPTSYVSVVTDALDAQGLALAAQLNESSYEEAIALIQAFMRDMSADIYIAMPIEDTGGDDTVIVTGEEFTQTISSEEILSGTQYSTNIYISEDDGTPVPVKQGGADTLSYTFTLAGDAGNYAIHLSPKPQDASLTLQALARVAPWLLLAMLVFSTLCAYLYSRIITRPIVRLSDVSQRMAELDFSWSGEQRREDEIGILGRNLTLLSTRLSDALDALNAANRALQQDIDRKDDLERQRLAFFSAVSHELKTPITILKGQLSGMLEGVDVYQDRDTYLAKALKVTGRMEALVQEILTIARMETGDASTQHVTLSLSALVQETLKGYQELIAQKALHLEQSLAPDAMILADRRLMGMALSNIISNAVLHTPEGSSLAVQTLTTREEAILHVTNSGVTIPDDALPHLFEAFYRVDPSRSRSGGGSGLGLYLVKLILQRHGARYALENTPQGVRFTLSLPISI